MRAGMVHGRLPSFRRRIRGRLHGHVASISECATADGFFRLVGERRHRHIGDLARLPSSHPPRSGLRRQGPMSACATFSIEWAITDERPPGNTVGAPHLRSMKRWCFPRPQGARMNIDFSPRNSPFSRRCEAGSRQTCPRAQTQDRTRHHALEGRTGRLAAHPQRPGLAGDGLAEGIRRPRLDAHPALHLRHGTRPRQCADRPVHGHHHAGPGAHGLRHAGAEGLLPAPHPQLRRLVVPGLLRAGRRFRPCQPQDHGGLGRR